MCGMSLYLDGMTSADLTSSRAAALVRSLWSGAAWRATRNGLAALGVAAVGTTLIGVLCVTWGAAIFSLVTGAGDLNHIMVYLAWVFISPVRALWAVQGATALQRSRLRDVAGVDIPAGSVALRRPWPIGPWLSASTWRQITFHVLSIAIAAGAGIVVACWLAPLAAIAFLIALRPA